MHSPQGHATYYVTRGWLTGAGALASLYGSKRLQQSNFARGAEKPQQGTGNA